MTLIELITMVGVVSNTGLLLSISNRLGRHSEKHDSHEKRLTLLEDKVYAKTFKRA